MKLFKVVISIFFVLTSLVIVLPVHSDDLVKVRGCIYNKNTGKKISSPFIVRVWTRNGNGGASGGVDGCYGGAGSSSGALQLNNSIGDWDFIEVMVRKGGRVYTQQYKLPPANLDSGITFLGIPSGVVRYDFYVDIPDEESTTPSPFGLP
jgi:hypothetical protein